jgi:hypothetical protein
MYEPPPELSCGAVHIGLDAMCYMHYASLQLEAAPAPKNGYARRRSFSTQARGPTHIDRARRAYI